MKSRPTEIVLATALVLVLAIALPGASTAQEGPAHLQDRGPGIPTSMFGSYIQRGELLVYPFFEYYLDDNAEYKPAELGYGLAQDFQGRFRASEGVLLLAYGVTDWLAVEFEAAVIRARLEKAPDDPSSFPAALEESGVGDVEGQVRWRWTRESTDRPEFFGYFEAVSPRQRSKPLIGTPDWELKAGVGLIRGFSWGTMTFRAAGEYLLENSSTAPGEFAVEYLRRLSPRWHVYAGIEGVEDEISLLAEAQWHLSRHATLKLNNGFGITPKAVDLAPEVGVMFRLPVGGQ